MYPATYVRTYVNLGNLTYLCFEAASKIHQHGNTMKLHKERANRIQQGTPQLCMTKQRTYVRLSILCFFLTSNPPFEQRSSTQASTASSVWPSSSHHPWRTCFGHPPTKCACEFVMRVSPSLCACACNARRPRIFVLLTTMPPPTNSMCIDEGVPHDVCLLKESPPDSSLTYGIPC